MMVFYTAVISFIIVYIQSIGSGMDVYSGLFNNSSVLVLFSSLIPLKPTKLTQAEQDSFLLSKELKQKLGFEKEISDTWFKWFIGFAEGDGAILSYQGRPQFVITQKEGKILYEIPGVCFHVKLVNKFHWTVLKCKYATLRFRDKGNHLLFCTWFFIKEIGIQVFT